MNLKDPSGAAAAAGRLARQPPASEPLPLASESAARAGPGAGEVTVTRL